MKILTRYIICILSVIVIFSSCAGEDIMLYHEKEPEPEPEPQPEYYWLLESVDYPESNKLEMQSRDDFTLTYNDADSIIIIDNDGGDYIRVDYKDKFFSFSRVRNSSATGRTSDSLLIYLNENKQIDYALHVTNIETFKDGELISNRRTQNDSTVCKYNAEGYMTNMDHYDYSGNNNSLSYAEEYVITDGNITEVTSSAGYHHIYTYDKTAYIQSASYVYEMPLNTISIKSRGGCWFMSSLPFLSAKYLGKASVNNVSRTVIKKIDRNGVESDYADIVYKYVLDENNMLSTATLSGAVNGQNIPDNYVSKFSHFGKEKK
ncbi:MULTISPECIES: hypothetical protein [unclassified Dysgonomonas]|uniref:hypothetical protein n=1 Tax=unclassified Dysgonomonas TaxID=2630389 RepID=UPI0025BCDC6C|nr:MULTISPECIES: hypothetical protein [unclassified Dysgonomonas]HMM03077.1 hypothetical protein [Dysgonomonas sp.]